MSLALEKAKKVAADHPEAIIIGADTIVLCDNKIYGKPHTMETAANMLNELRGRSHNVCTGVAVISLESGLYLNFVETSQVSFTNYSKDTMNWYLDTGEGLDKAGSYAIQGKGCILVDSISGDYDNIVGLPIARLMRELAVKNIFLY